MVLVEQVKDVPAYIRKMYGYNSFMNNFGVHIDEITCGGAVVSIDKIGRASCRERVCQYV